LDTPAKKPEPARQAGALVFGTTLATLSSALTPLLIVRLIGKADVAKLLSITLVYETLAMLLALGLPYTMLYQLSNREPPARAAIARRLARTACMLGLGGAALVYITAAVAALLPAGLVTPTFQHQLELLLILSPSLAADLPFRLLPNLLIAEGRARQQALLQVVRTIALTAATLVPLALQANVTTVVVVYAIVRWSFGPVVLWVFRALYGAVERVPSPLGAKHLIAFALPLGATEILGQLNAQLDRWLILLALPSVRFADYQAGAWQVPIVGTIAYAVGSAYTPELVRLFQAKEPYAALELWKKGIHKTTLIVVPITMALLVGADELMPLMFTHAYASAADIFRCYSVLTFLRVAAFGNVLVAAGRPGLVVRAAGLGLFYNVMLGIPLVLTIGFVGPALGAALGFVLTVTTYVVLIGRAAGVPARHVFPLANYLRVFALASVAGALGYGVKRLLPVHAALLLTAEIVTVLGAFILLGTLTKTIARSDWAFVRDWLKLKH
jgi:O-antigen/teichoic acid export membrane protein